MPEETIEPEGLRVALDKLVHHQENQSLPEVESHAFIYFLSIHNMSDRKVTLLGRKWVLENDDGTTTVVEGDKIVGETPTLACGESFSYNSYHVTSMNAKVLGSYHGVDQLDQKIHVNVPEFELIIPDEDSSDPSLS